MKIYISAFSDSRAPVSKRRIVWLIKQANIRLKILKVKLELLNYCPSVGCKEIKIGYVRHVINKKNVTNKARKKDFHYRVFFTDRCYIFTNKTSVESDKAKDSEQFLGLCQVDVFALYGLKQNARCKDLGGHNLNTTTLLHELGHFFGLDHNPSQKYLMHEPISKTFGNWHKEEKRKIKEYFSGR